MNLSHTYQMNRLINWLILVKGNTVKIDTIADTDRTLSENFLCIREGDDGCHLTSQTMAEELINLQTQALLTGKSIKLLIIGIGGNFRDSLDTQLMKTFEETDQEWIGVLEATGIDKLNAVEFAIVIDTVVVYTLAEACHKACAIVLNDLIVYISATVTLGIKVIVAEMDFIAVFAQSFHLVMDLLTDATNLGETVIDEEQYLHLHNFLAKIGKNLELNKIIRIFVVVKDEMT